MKIIYVADDEKEFDNEFDCQEYEWKLKHPHLNNIKFYDKNNNVLDEIFSQETYNIVKRVIVPDEDAVNDLQEFANYTGFCCYEDIISRGEWIFNTGKGTFVKWIFSPI